MTGGQDHGRIPSLDGLRAISILCVLLAHATHGFTGVHVFGRMALFGVRVFFVISGFLITSLLLKEEAKTGTISLRFFYLRRTLRIFPPFYVFIGVAVLGAYLGWFELQHHDVLAAMTYLTNYHHHRAWTLGHAWSLSVEEQFYLLWPFLVKWLRSERASRIALAAVIIGPFLRFGLLLFAPELRPGIGETFPTVADSIATGCVLACYRGRIARSPRLLAFLRGRAFWWVPAIAVLAAQAPSAKLDALIWQSVCNIGIAALIWRVVDNPGDWAGRFLNARPVVFVGMLSYSLYLWQQPFFNRDSALGVARFPLNVVVTVLLALTSYYVVERPALRFRTWIERRVRAARAAVAPPQLSPAPPA
jgi:peptidoglycan/LPS O-acetylase OafA/YrhL